MQYGSIGWSVGATLGYAQAATKKRVIACIGDGSFQVSVLTCEPEIQTDWKQFHNTDDLCESWGFKTKHSKLVISKLQNLSPSVTKFLDCFQSSHKHFDWQVTAQDVSTMIRNDQKSIIFLINNGGYTIEVEIHDGPYNVIKNWNYTGLVDAIHNGEGNCWTKKVNLFQGFTGLN